MSKRLFAAIDVPHTLSQAVCDEDLRLRGVRWLDPDQLHLTLGFFGSVNEEVEGKLREGLATISFQSFFLPLTGLGTFNARGKPAVIWVGVGHSHPHLFQLYKRVQEAAMRSGLEPETRAFNPHITVARCRDVMKQMLKPFLQAHVGFDAGLFRVSEFHLYSSRPAAERSIYTRELTIAAQDHA